MNQFIEIRSLNIKPGTRGKFHQHYIEKALHLLQRWKFDVAAHGPSLHMEAKPDEKVRGRRSLR
jgi:hypothetical protein